MDGWNGRKEEDSHSAPSGSDISHGGGKDGLRGKGVREEGRKMTTGFKHKNPQTKVQPALVPTIKYGFELGNM